ncbi:acetyl-CoA carboxylase [Halobacterium bonnevillei]|jgi:acetyl-CoA carboxylase biotin carboxyl carrier protein|uniref:Biotin carboxyl carrier protein of acetyl-CoA carboxylase n=1 Tax=Halobacterium bonnevillei TaxID=2692200 RepID=A0A6B0SQU1_9EURY|nr:acetyl-CoA carboxylase [Halobacterium bonnevillei]MXR21933.1 biotin carboxyl carrier domain-containing protein [Halobacterium bonnevillei]
MTERTTVTAPMPGVFYRRPDPDEPTFVEPGDAVESGEVIGLIGVMKNFHDITADEDGEVVEFFVENEQEVDAGDELAELEVS